MAFRIVGLVTAALLSATPENTDFGQALVAFDAQRTHWRTELQTADGVLIESQGTGPSLWLGWAIFIPAATPGTFQAAELAVTRVNRLAGRLDAGELARLEERSSRHAGYSYRCRCLDASALTVTIRRKGKISILSAYGLDDEAKQEGAVVLREWDALHDRLLGQADTRKDTAL
ncbi:MAG: hypothetical protein IIZ63_08205 [Caulobacteraceae bacterium]|nr:hypothetical protein [Caulobacteraceae bacterium]